MLNLRDAKKMKAKALVLLGLLLLILLHGGLVLRQFPVQSLRDGNPLCSGDLNWHFACGAEGDQFVKGQHKIWGYSPSFMAGYPYGTWNSVSKRGHELATALLPGTDVEAGYYLWLVLTAFSVPFLVALACRLLGASWRMTGGCLALSIAIYQFGSIVTYFWTFGNVVFPFVTSLCLLYTALLYRSLADPHPSPLPGGEGAEGHRSRGARCCTLSSIGYPLSSGLLLGIIFWLQSLCLVPAGLATLAVMLECRRELRKIRGWAVLAGVGVLGLAVSWPWLSVLLSMQDARIAAPPGLPSSIKHFVMDVFSDRGYGQPYDRRTLFHVLMVLSVVGVLSRSRPPTTQQPGNSTTGPQCLLALGLTAAGLLFCTYAFSYSELFRNTQPYRYLVSATMFMLVPATWGCGQVLQWFRETNRQGKVLAGCLAAVLAPCLIGYGFDAAQRDPAKGLSESQMQVVTWLRGQGEVKGRVMCQDGTLGNMLPHLVGAEVIGGNFSGPPLRHSWASTGLAGFLYRGPADIMTPAVLRAHLDLYNIRVVIAENDQLKRALAALAGDEDGVKEFGRLSVLVMADSGEGWIWGDSAGNGVQVDAKPNRIVIRNAPQGTWGLKYHFMQSLRVRGEQVSIRPVHRLGDPIPFIEVVNPGGVKDIEIWNGY